MQIVLNLAFNVISFIVSLISIPSPVWIVDIVGAVAKYGTYAQYFVPVVTFFQVSLFCLGVHLSLMIVSAVLQLI